MCCNCSECWPKESGVVEGVEVCGWEVGVCGSGEGMGDSARNGSVRWHV